MDVKAVLAGQYHAALDALKGAIKGCPDKLWEDGKSSAPYWQVVYHTLFYTHLYLSEELKAFRTWEHHREEYQSMRVKPARGAKKALVLKPYTKQELLAYWAFVDAHVDERIKEMDLEAATCGFWWYEPMNKLEHQLNNIRHVQHHAAALAMRLRVAGCRGVGWVGARREKRARPARKKGRK